MRKVLERLGAVVARVGARDFLVCGGVALLTLGAGMVYRPAAPLVAGAALLTLGIFGVPSWR